MHRGSADAGGTSRETAIDPPERFTHGASCQYEPRPIRATTSRAKHRLLVRKSYKARPCGGGTIFVGLGRKTAPAAMGDAAQPIDGAPELHAGSPAPGP